jgi:hypothetical protein
MSEPRVLRYEVPVDDQWHVIEFDGHVCYVSTRNPRVVEFWTAPSWQLKRVDTGNTELISEDWIHYPYPQRRQFRVYGTGHLLEDGGNHEGSVITAGGALVWHLFSRGVPAVQP